MFAKPKSSVFIDAVVLEVDPEAPASLKAVLKDETGSEMRCLETEISRGQTRYSWRGLDDLPYGVYMLELFHGDQETRLRMVKRV
jgi:hypothetical protein